MSDGPPQKPYNTLVLSAEPSEDGVWLTSDSDEETRGVLIAGEPLDQPVVQVSGADQCQMDTSAECSRITSTALS